MPGAFDDLIPAQESMQPEMSPEDHAQLMQESGGNTMALSPKGAAGRWQIMPATARDPGYGVKPLQGWDGVDPRTAPQAEQDRFHADYQAAMDREMGSHAGGLAAYNAGPGRMGDVVAGKASLPAETADYVNKITGAPLELNGTYAAQAPAAAAPGPFDDLIPTKQMQAPQAEVQQQPDYGFGAREDGTGPKGLGFLGMKKRPDGMVSSEISVGVNIDGKEIDVPSMVPTLTPDEVNYLINGGDPRKSPEIMQKAAQHAIERLKQGKSVFATEQDTLQNPVGAFDDLIPSEPLINGMPKSAYTDWWEHPEAPKPTPPPLDYGPAPGLGEGLLNQAALSTYRQAEGAKMLAGNVIGDKAMSEDAKQNIRGANEAEQIVVPQVKNPVGKAVYGAAGGLAASVPELMAMGINPILGLAGFGVSGGTEAAGQVGARGGTPTQQALAGSAIGAINMAGGAIPLKYFVNALGKVGMGEFVTNLIAREIPTMAAQQVASSAVDTAVANPDKTWAQWLKEQPEGVAQAVAGALMFSGVGAAAHGITKSVGASAPAEPAAGRAPAAEAPAAAPVTPAAVGETIQPSNIQPPAGREPVVAPPAESPAKPPQAPANPAPVAPPEVAPIAPPAAVETPQPAPAQRQTLPETPAAGTSRVITPDNKMEVDVKPEVVELSSLISSENPKFDKSLQPRDRTRQSSDAQTTEIANRLDPARLDESRTTDQGAPIVGTDHLVESGNGRVMAIRKAYENGGDQVQKYRQYLSQKGFDLTGMKEPVLIRRNVSKLTPEERQQFAMSSNERAAAGFSTTERAMADAKGLTPDDVALYRGGDVTSLANTEFRKRFMSKITANDRGTMTNPDGTLSQEGVRRINAGLLARGYGSADIVTKLTEDTDTNIKGIGNALQSVAGEMARLRAATESGQVPKSMDISKQIVRAAQAVADARANGKPISETVNQDGMFASENLDPITKEIIKSFYQPDLKRAASAEKIEAFLRKYVQEAEKATPGEDMLGNKELTPQDILRAIQPRGEDTTAQGGLDLRKKPALEPAEDSMTMADEASRPPGSSGGVSTGGKTLEGASYTNRPSFRRQMYEAMGLDPEKAVNMAPRAIIPKAQALFKKTFGIDVELGPGADLGKSLDNLTDAWISFQYLARVLGIPNKGISLRGLRAFPEAMPSSSWLKLVMKKNSHGALGTYDGMTHTINIPGRSNSFAHEWGHGLDFMVLHAMGQVKDGMDKFFKGFSGRIRREGIDYRPDSLGEAWVNFMNTVFFNDSFGAAKIMELQEKISRTKSPKVEAELQQQIEKIKAGNYAGHDYRSEYYKNVKSIPALGDKGYWQRPTEMLARIFEAYVAHKVAGMGGSTEFLTKGNDTYLNTSEDFVAKAYPQLEDRARIFLAMDQMIEKTREAGLFADGAVDENGLPKAEDEKLWMGDVSDPEQRGYIEKIKDWWSKEGRQYRKEAADYAKAMEDARPKNPLTRGQVLSDIARGALSSAATSINAILARQKNKSTALHSIARSVAKKPGSNEYQQTTYFQDRDMFNSKYMNALGRVIHTNGIDPNNAKEMKLLGQMQVGQRETIKVSPERYDALKKASAQMRKIYDSARYEANNMMAASDAKDIGYYGDAGYMYLDFDKAKIEANPKGAKEDFAQAYGIKFEKEFPEGGGDHQEFFKLASAILGFHDPRVKELYRALSGEDPEHTQELIDNMYDDVKEGYSDQRAEALLTRLRIGEPFDRGTSSSTGFKKHRTMPAETIPILDKWRTENPVWAQMKYVAKLSRHAAYEKHFHDMYERMKKAVMEQGFIAEDAKSLVDHVETMTGRNRIVLPSSQQRVINFARAFLSSAIMGRAPFASLPENFVLSMTTGHVADSWKALYYTTKALLKTKDMQQLRDALEHAGALHSAMADTAGQERIDGTYLTDPKSEKFLARFYENNMLGGLTRVQETGNAASIILYLRRLTKSVNDFYGGEPGGDVKRAEAAIRTLKNFGVNADIAKEFSKYVQEQPQIFPLAEDVGAGKDTAPFAKLYMQAIDTVLRQTIQRPNAATAPLWSQGNAGAFVYSLMKFNYAYWDHAIKSNKNFFMTEKGRVGIPAAAAKTTARFMPAYLQYLGVNMGVFMLRTMLFYPSKIDELEKEGEGALLKYLLLGGIGYTLPGGPAGDVLLNMLTGVKYEKDLTSITAGASVSAQLQNMQSIIKSLQKPSKNTNTSQRNLVKGIYSLLISNMSTYATGMIPGAWGKAMGLANMIITSGRAKEAAATAIAGPKKGKDNAD